MKKIELLAPAGNMESLKAAIHAGCDAVYLAGKFFGARSFAGNFTNEELKEATEYAHLYGVKIYITVNIIVYESEVKAFLHYVDYLVEIGVDAFIIQDLGMMDLLRHIYPDLELHASTQMNVHNKEGVLFLEKLGIKRVILARETPIDIIKEIKKETTIEIEVFGHGALCMGYSGNCYMSYFIGGRSGNRGTCAQCCRQPFEIIDGDKKKNQNEYVLSMKDLCTLEYLDQFIESGIDSLKIEGRMKRPEYVYMVVKTYREAIDGYYNGKTLDIKESLLELHKLFSRTFTKGFLFHEKNENVVNSFRPNHQGTYLGNVFKIHKGFIEVQLMDTLSMQDGIRILNQNEDVGFTVTKIMKNNQKITEGKKGDIVLLPCSKKVKVHDKIYKTTDAKQMNKIETLMKKEKKITIQGKIILKEGQKAILNVTDGIHNIIVESDMFVQTSDNHPILESVIQEKISQLGNTIYEWKNLKIICDSNIFFPLKELKEMRRKFVEKLNQERIKIKKLEKKEYKIDLPNFERQRNINLYLSTGKKVVDSNYRYIYVENDDIDAIQDVRVIKRLPRIMNSFPEEKGLLLISDLGSLGKYKNICTDFSFNVVNSYTVAFLHRLGVLLVTLSYELNEKQVKKIIESYHERYHKHPNVEVIVEGNLEAMITKYDLYNAYSLKKPFLKDKYQNMFEIQKKNDYNIIYHYQKRKDEYPYFDIGVNNVRVSGEEEVSL